MKKILIGAVILVVLGLIGYNFYLECQHDRLTVREDTETMQVTQPPEKGTETLTSETTGTGTNQGTSGSGGSGTEGMPAADPDKEKIKIYLHEFGRRFLNYETIYQRNQSVKSFFTEKASLENGLDVDPHADFARSGNVKGVYQSMDNEGSYIITAEETSDANTVGMVLEIDLAEEDGSPKIDRLAVHYVRQAY